MSYAFKCDRCQKEQPKPTVALMWILGTTSDLMYGTSNTSPEAQRKTMEFCKRCSSSFQLFLAGDIG